MCLLRRRIGKARRLQLSPKTLPENHLSNLTLENIERELHSLNVNLAEANDIAMLSAFSSMPANLDNESRSALGKLRDLMMERAKARTGV